MVRVRVRMRVRVGVRVVVRAMNKLSITVSGRLGLGCWGTVLACDELSCNATIVPLDRAQNVTVALTLTLTLTINPALSRAVVRVQV